MLSADDSSSALQQQQRMLARMLQQLHTPNMRQAPLASLVTQSPDPVPIQRGPQQVFLVLLRRSQLPCNPGTEAASPAQTCC
jgi:hypothetical protein